MHNKICTTTYMPLLMHPLIQFYFQGYDNYITVTILLFQYVFKKLNKVSQ